MNGIQNNCSTCIYENSAIVWSTYVVALAVFALLIGISDLSLGAKLGLSLSFGLAPLPFLIHAIKTVSDEESKKNHLIQKKDFIAELGEEYLRGIYLSSEPSFLLSFAFGTKCYTAEIGPRKDGIEGSAFFLSKDYADSDIEYQLASFFGESIAVDEGLCFPLTGEDIDGDDQELRLNTLREILKGNSNDIQLISTGTAIQSNI